jgi:signal transduction histidine kinase/DNA-binding NarL/FixJ family response regulator
MKIAGIGALPRWLAGPLSSPPKAGVIVAAIASLSAVSVLWVGLSLLDKKREIESQVRLRTSNIVNALDQEILSSIGKIDLALHGVVDELNHQLASQGRLNLDLINEQIGRDVARISELESIRVTKANGFMIAGTLVEGGAPVDLSDRSYFIAQKSASSDRVIVSRPIESRVNGDWLIVLARRYQKPDGSFAGIVTASINVRHFERLLSVLDLGENGIAVIRDTDELTMVARYPAIPGPAGALGNRLASRELRDLVAAKVQSATFHSAGTADRVERINSIRLLTGTPFIVIAGMASSTYLAPWYADVRRSAALVGGYLFVLSLLGVALWRSWRGLESAAENARQASQAKSSFLAMMSHEIRTPMNAVLGLAQTVLESDLNDEQKSSVVAIRDAGESLLEILNGVLDFSKLEAGKLTLETVAFSPAGVVHGAASIFRSRASMKGIGLRIDEDLGLPAAVSGDVGRIRQVLLNLLSNALKFTEKGEVTLAVRCVATNTEKAEIEWSVGDTGIGMSEETLRGLFVEFQQADSSISRRFGGSGLGLAICKRLVATMGGKIDAISTLGQGSMFWFSVTLPLTEQVAIVAPNDEQVFGDMALTIAALGRPLRLLIADDDPTNLLVATKMLNQFDIDIQTVCDGGEAVSAATTTAFDIILMDMRMPQVDGLQATRKIRARGGDLATVPIIAFTANAFAEDIKACADAGMNDFVAKPVRKKLLIETLWRALCRRESAPNLAPSQDTGALTFESASATHVHHQPKAKGGGIL